MKSLIVIDDEDAQLESQQVLVDISLDNEQDAEEPDEETSISNSSPPDAPFNLSSKLREEKISMLDHSGQGKQSKFVEFINNKRGIISTLISAAVIIVLFPRVVGVVQQRDNHYCFTFFSFSYSNSDFCYERELPASRNYRGTHRYYYFNPVWDWNLDESTGEWGPFNFISLQYECGLGGTSRCRYIRPSLFWLLVEFLIPYFLVSNLIERIHDKTNRTKGNT